MNAVLFIIYAIVSIAIYVFIAWCLQTIAKRFNIENDWFAYVPILNMWLMTKIAEREVLWFILLLIPCVNIIAMIIIWMDIAEKCGKERWFGILMIIPLVNLWVVWTLAQA
jgi:hypothetical protein